MRLFAAAEGAREEGCGEVGGPIEQGRARAARSKTTQGGVRSLAGVQGGGSAGSPCPGLRQQAAAGTLRLGQSGQRSSAQPTKATSASHSRATVIV